MQLNKIANKKIIVSALDWGMGHCTRLSVLINILQQQNNDIIIFTTPEQKQFWIEQFPNLEIQDIPPYNIRYTSKYSIINLSLQIPKIIKTIIKEYKTIKHYLKTNQVDYIISDSRYGLKNSLCTSIIITHQVNMQLPKALRIANKIHHILLNRFDIIWIPDFQEDQKSLAGKLSHTINNKLLKKIDYINPLSSFEASDDKPVIDVLVILSGPNPAKSELENKLTVFFETNLNTLNILMINCNNEDKSFKRKFINPKQLHILINRSKIIISRSGYSFLMASYQFVHTKKLILIPTPNQYEQIYLAEYWKWKYSVSVINEDDYLQKNLKNLLS